PFVFNTESSSLSFSPKLKSQPIKFNLSKQAKLTAKVYNSKGQVIDTLFTNRMWAPGNHYFYWSGKKNGETPYGDGTYVLKIT
ncbi:hypothetical protein ICJ84_16715, partial [Aestuariibaculum suncheonense]|nr:hypothetical protein [Aestuariibaculum suncheonense]